ncbi:MAG: hypothetical protein ACE5JJ_00435 [Nitrospinota bacterium]
MARRILGVELGARSVKAVGIRHGWRRCVLERVLCLDLPASTPEEGDWSEAREALRGWAGRRGRAPFIVASFPGTGAIAAFLRLPFRQVSKIKQVIKFEMERVLPLPVEETVADFAVTAGPNREGLEVLAVAVPKVALARYLQGLAEVGVVPDRVDFAPLADLRAWRALGGSLPDGPTGVVNIGATHTSIVLADGGRPVFIRAIRRGADQTFSRPGAERADGLPGRESGPTHASAPDGIASLVRELQLTLHACDKLPGLEGGVARLVLTGDGAALPGLAHRLESALGIPCQPMAWEAGAALVAGEVPTPEAVVTVSGALGAALGAARPLGARLNLLREEFARREGWRELRRPVLAAGAAAALAGALLVADLALKVRRGEERMRRVRAEVHSLFRAALPAAGRTVSPERQLAARVEAQARRLALLMGSRLNGLTPLGALAELSEAIPAALPVRLLELEMDDRGISLRGETLSFEAVDRIKSLLARRKGFEGLEVTQARLLPGERGVRFHMRLRFGVRVAG